MQSSSRNRLPILVFLILFVILGAWALRRHFPSQPPQPAIPAASAVPAKKPMREILIYFGAADASRLIAETRAIEDCPIEEDCVRATVQALIDGPTGALVSVLPPGVVLRSATLRDTMAELDFSRELVSAHPGGSVSELFTVYALADSLAANFPRIRQVRILVEGAPVETLKGHVGLLQPILADFTYTRPVEEGSTGMAAQPAAPAATGGERL